MNPDWLMRNPLRIQNKSGQTSKASSFLQSLCNRNRSNCQALYHEPLAPVIAQALPVFDIKFDLHFTFTTAMSLSSLTLSLTL